MNILEIGIEKGRKEGRKEGEIKGKAETLLKILESKGEVPETLCARILVEKNAEMLDEWIKKALSCSDVGEFASGLE